MISFSEAINFIKEESLDFRQTQKIKISDLTPNHVLAMDILADRDFPPFDRVMMDGIALKYSQIDFSKQLTVKDIIPAGAISTKELNSNEVYKIATGAKLPANCDVVIQKELLLEEGGKLFYQGKDLPKIGKNIHKKGIDHKAGGNLFSLGQKMNSSVVASLATLGFSEISCFKAPTVSILSTGNEIVPIDATPTDVQLRDANAQALIYKLKNLGITPHHLGIAPDDESILKEKLKLGLESDLLIVTAGVSAGDKDLVPSILKSLGVEEIFHKIKMKPGKPVWFGKKGKTLVFGLPGNPVSVMVTFELFVKSLLSQDSQSVGKLKNEYEKNEIREEWSMANFSSGVLTLIPHSSSGDMVNLAKANALVNFSEGKQIIPSGANVTWIPFT